MFALATIFKFSLLESGEIKTNTVCLIQKHEVQQFSKSIHLVIYPARCGVLNFRYITKQGDRLIHFTLSWKCIIQHVETMSKYSPGAFNIRRAHPTEILLVRQLRESCFVVSVVNNKQLSSSILRNIIWF